MLTVVIRRNAEPSVIQLTMENLQKELGPLVGAELFVEEEWKRGVKRAKNDFVCLVEADCLVSSGYFSSLMGLFQKNPRYRQLAMLASAVGVNNWANRVYGYEIDKVWSEEVDKISTARWAGKPLLKKKSSEPYAVQVGFVPGAVIRRNALLSVLDRTTHDLLAIPDLTVMSVDISRRMWDSSRHVHLNPNTTYVTTEKVDQDTTTQPLGKNLKDSFHREAI